MTAVKTGVRGIRDTLPPGVVIGRMSNAGSGAPQLIDINDLRTQISAGGVTPVTLGGTGLSGGTSGGVLAFTAATTIASSGLLTNHALVLGGGAGATPSTPVGLGTTTTVLHGNAAGNPTWGAVVLTTDVSGVLPEANGGTNQSGYTLGDTLYASAVNTLSKLAGNTAGTRKFLRQTGTGAVSAAPAWDTVVAADIPGSALSTGNDTNVTLTTGGTPLTALLAAASITAGWTGQLGLTRGGTAASLTAANGGVVYSTASALAINTPGSSGNWLQSAGAAAPTWAAAAALTKTNDTNVTLTLGGSATTALLNAASITAGWTGQLGLTRGGTAASLVASTGGIVYSGAGALAILSGTATAGQILRSGASAAPTWSTPTFPNTATANKALVGDGTNIVLSTPTIPLTSSPSSNKVMVGDGTNWVASTPTVPLTSSPSAGVILRGDATNWVASTNTYPDTTTVNQVLYATGSNVIGSGSGLTFNGTTLTANTLSVSTGGINSVKGIWFTGATGASNAANQGAIDINTDTVRITSWGPNSSTNGAFQFTTKASDGSGGLNVIQVGTAGDVEFPNIGTTASAANAFLNSGSTPANSLLRSTSSIRYKPFVRDMDLDVARRIVLEAVPVEYTHVSGRRGIGLIAEREARDERLITHDALGRPDWVQYPHYVAPLCLVAQDHERRLAAAGL